jgi:NAD(P)-dependent dehydrogenase (short-subunit alcohol dehydrogenase family)
MISHLLESKYSEFDVLINAAGVGVGHSFYNREIFLSSVRVNLEIPFLLSSILIQQNLALKKNLSIINITSLGASLGFPNNPSYQITKAGLAQLTRSISADYSQFGIRANNLVPGYIKSGMTKLSWDDLNLRKQRAERTTMNRWGQPDELVGAIKFLASDLSSYVTGTDLVVDGGWSSKGL